MNVERLTEEKQLGPFASLKDKAETRPGAFHDYDCLYAHMVAVTQLKAYEDTNITPSDIADLRNELCLKCGKYKTEHLGSCDGCRWHRKGA
jgi:hypothetical protein